MIFCFLTFTNAFCNRHSHKHLQIILQVIQVTNVCARWQIENEYRELCRQTEPWPTAADLVWLLAPAAAAGTTTVSCRRMEATPVHTDCYASMMTTALSREAAVLGRVVGMSSD